MVRQQAGCREKVRNLDASGYDAHPLADLQIQTLAGRNSSLSETPFWSVQYHQCFSIDLRRVAAMHKTLKNLDGTLQHQERKLGPPEKFTAYLARCAVALHISSFGFNTGDYSRKGELLARSPSEGGTDSDDDTGGQSESSADYLVGARLRHMDGSEATVTEPVIGGAFVWVETDSGLPEKWPANEIAGFGTIELAKQSNAQREISAHSARVTGWHDTNNYQWTDAPGMVWRVGERLARWRRNGK